MFFRCDPTLPWGCSVIVLLAGFSATAEAEPFDHSLFDSILRESVKEGVVDYSKIRMRYSDLQVYLKRLESADLSRMNRWEKEAFYINAYNAHCIDGVLSHGVVKSVREVPSFFKRTRFVLAGKEMNLDELEHKILRKMDDPRIHFAIVCASSSCPKLASRAYVGATLENELECRAREFFNDPTKNRLDREKGVFYASKILQWFKKDFTRHSRSVLEFASRYLNEEDRRYLNSRSNRLRVQFLDYDWTLNGHF